MSESVKLDAAEKELFRDSVKKFLEAEVEPHYQKWEDDGIWPRELWSKLGENGFLCVDMPSRYGGYDAPFELSCVIIEEISRAGYGALATGVSVHSDIAAPYILHLGTESQKEYWIPKLVSGEVVAAIGMSEPSAGSDLQGMKTTAIKDGDDYIVNGQKTFISNGQHADVIILATKTDPKQGARGMSLFVVDCHLDGYEKGRNLEKMGLHSGDTSEIFFSDMRVPATEILGGEGKGFISLMDELPRERLILGVGCVAAAEGMLDWTIEYTMERKAFGESIAKFQNSRYVMADMKAEIELNKALAEKYVDKYMNGDLTTAEASICKLAASEMQCRVADRCVQLFGGYGYMKEYKISRAYVDARIQRIYGGTSEIMKELISRSLVGR
ncbi:MAG TPA: acyl-CoA dehydrogenase family protein [Pseudomonadales bacterium]|jgi:alkylation response protein AidB-like acyl-CoA dehydrogenase|nr:acyl-CoA dehydrogenase family protein [Pseudomonadales bacterium]MDP6314609.1 acyl-CoA dehydrogenase family protein [Pseudomonadales bacterium]MDP7313410.1 acyl-CoA dehydrogenase family protein [Pseudomonadales bacterium]HJL61412.1 acyl-CoA dehydrogenase family protein [Pseudomonadales bacterium]HJP49620.1 acyl-CoA dehydrogenase family protein [Pseudomonadales bacterium]|tara:strand:- start:51 stop:1205 length:1155 start_codon:yes stop_codon:yes gene_type:complete